MAALSKKLRDEDAQAAALVDQFITGPRSWWKVRIIKSGKASTYGMVEQLLGRADSVLYTAPADALELTSVAVEIADDLRIDAYPFDLVVKPPGAGAARSCLQSLLPRPLPRGSRRH